MMGRVGRGIALCLGMATISVWLGSVAYAQPGASRLQSHALAVSPRSAAVSSNDSTGSPTFRMPPYSIRFDPFNWLIQGRFDVEFEVAVWRFISVELIPTLVVNRTPPTFDFGGRDAPLEQHSAGLGPISGASLGVGFWLFGTPLQGYVLRLSMSNIGTSYRAVDASGEFDRVDKVERRLQLLIGSHSRFDWFTISGGLGFGYELHSQERCFVNQGRPEMAAVTAGCQEEGLTIMLDRLGGGFADLNGPLHPFYFLARFSVGVVFD